MSGTDFPSPKCFCVTTWQQYCQGVFGRLWNDSLDRQKRRFLQKERREKIQSALQSAPVYVLDENPAERVGRPCSASRTQQTEETEAIEVSAKPSLSSAPAPLDPSNASTSPSAEDAHRRPSKTLLPSDLSLRHVSRRRASAPEVITRSWCLSDRPSNQSATASNLSPPSPTASLIIRQFSPSPSRLSDPQVDLATEPQDAHGSVLKLKLFSMSRKLLMKNPSHDGNGS